MIQEEKYSTFKPDNTTSFLVFFNDFNAFVKNNKENNIILDLSDYSIKLDDLLQFTKITEEKIEVEKSFVIINNEIDIDGLPDELIIVPTFQEAVDIIDMDEMTRNLDF